MYCSFPSCFNCFKTAAGWLRCLTTTKCPGRATKAGSTTTFSPSMNFGSMLMPSTLRMKALGLTGPGASIHSSALAGLNVSLALHQAPAANEPITGNFRPVWLNKIESLDSPFHMACRDTRCVNREPPRFPVQSDLQSPLWGFSLRMH